MKEKQLTVFGYPSLEKGPWAKLLAETITLVNGLIDQGGVDFKFIPATGEARNADVEVDLADGVIQNTWGNHTTEVELKGHLLHGKILLLPSSVNRKEYIDRALVYLPKRPIVPFDKKARTVGRNGLQCVLGHELIHACAVDAKHTLWDLFDGNPQYDPSDDKVYGQQGGKMVKTPPFFLLPETITKIRAIWPAKP
jgi:hypothetical protein